MSKRDWLILGLTVAGETTKKNVLDASLKSIFGDSAQLFFPYRSEENQRHQSKAMVLEGYIFVKTDFKRVNFHDIEKSPYFSMLSGKPKYVDNEYITKLKAEMKNISEEEFYPGDYVKITDGTYAPLEGEVVREDRASVCVLIVSKSRSNVVTVPKLFIEKV